MQLDTLQFELVQWSKLSMRANSNTAIASSSLSSLLLPHRLASSGSGHTVFATCPRSVRNALAFGYRRFNAASV